LGLLLIIVVPCLSADLTPGEKRRIGSAAEDALKDMISLWKEDRYEDLYDYGTGASRISISREGFVRQMKVKSWKLSTSWETIRDVEADVISVKLVYVRAKIGFKGIIGSGDTRFVTETFEMNLEGDKWRTNLFRILSCP
jgi:hypothetical protein